MNYREKFLEIIKRNGIQTKEVGKNTFILCPFHADKNPSMIINDFTGYCFACEERYNFNDILHKYNIQEKVFIANKEVEKHYKYNEILERYLRKSKEKLIELLNSNKYSYIKNYLLKERNIKKEVLEKEDIGVLIKDEEIIKSLTDLKKQYKEFEESIDKLLPLINKDDYDTILFFYRNSNYNVSSIKFRNPRLQKRFQFKFWRKGKNTGVWGLKKLTMDKNRILGVEGEFNLLSLKSVLPDTNVIAIGSSNNFDVFTIKDIATKLNLEFYYCYDNDEAGFKVVEELKNHINVYTFTTPFYNDLDEARKKIQNDDEFVRYLKDTIKSARLFKHNTKNWNGIFYSANDFEIKDNCLYYKDKKI